MFLKRRFCKKSHSGVHFLTMFYPTTNLKLMYCNNKLYLLPTNFYEEGFFNVPNNTVFIW